jgi:hypothetical protein
VARASDSSVLLVEIEKVARLRVALVFLFQSTLSNGISQHQNLRVALVFIAGLAVFSQFAKTRATCWRANRTVSGRFSRDRAATISI